MPTYINCPFKDKEIVKSLGARWDHQRKSWYVPDGCELSKFSKWLNESSTEQSRARFDKTDVKSLSKKLSSSPPEDEILKGSEVLSLNAKAENSYSTDVTKNIKNNVEKKDELYKQYLCSCKVLAWDSCEHSVAYELYMKKVMQSFL